MAADFAVWRAITKGRKQSIGRNSAALPQRSAGIACGITSPKKAGVA
jgi:hypothetical protein